MQKTDSEMSEEGDKYDWHTLATNVVFQQEVAQCDYLWWLERVEFVRRPSPVLAQKYIKFTARNQCNIPDNVHNHIQMVEGLNGRPYNSNDGIDWGGRKGQNG